MWPFRKKELIVIASVTDPVVEALVKQIQEMPPCPLEIALNNLCICCNCKFALNCPMELVCRNEGCKATIGGCTVYDSEGDKNAENKRKVFFKDRTIFEPNVFRFCGKKPEKNLGGE